MKVKRIKSGDNVIKSEELIAWMEELTAEMKSMRWVVEMGREADGMDQVREELTALESLIEELETGCGDWEEGEMIRETHFTAHVMTQMRKCGEFQSLPWYVVLDEEATAKRVRGPHYVTVHFDGEPYLIHR